MDLLLIMLVVLGLVNCEIFDLEYERKISRHGEMESHKAGSNCMDCHTPGRSGEGFFEVAGTVYTTDPSPTTVFRNTTIEFYSDSNGSGTLVATIEVDGRGNFFTTESIDWGSGLYAVVSSGNTEPQYKPYRLKDSDYGACNRCHGNGTARIWVD